MEESKENIIVLVVDDDEFVRMHLSVLVKALGYSCLTSGGSEEAVKILEFKPVDIVLSDVVMPGMDGMALLAYIREHHKDTDVIISTGFSQTANYAEVIKAGAIDFIKKPIDPAELEAKMARAIRERTLVRELERLSMHDALTSLLNRRSFDERFPYEVGRAHRQNYSLILALIDVDNFKEYNDEHGHQAGDEVLISLGTILAECTRDKVDMCFRLGGDEFCVLLPQASAVQGLEIVERIRASFLERGFGGTTLSIGLVECKRDTDLTKREDEQSMMARADHAMYDAKNSGKNCVVSRVT